MIVEKWTPAREIPRQTFTCVGRLRDSTMQMMCPDGFRDFQPLFQLERKLCRVYSKLPQVHNANSPEVSVIDSISPLPEGSREN